MGAVTPMSGWKRREALGEVGPKCWAIHSRIHPSLPGASFLNSRDLGKVPQQSSFTCPSCNPLCFQCWFKPFPFHYPNAERSASGVKKHCATGLPSPLSFLLNKLTIFGKELYMLGINPQFLRLN